MKPFTTTYDPKEAGLNKIVQACLLKAYAGVERTGLLSTAWGRSAFIASYGWYKRFLEAGDVEALHAYVRPGGVVFDIGANVGFFTVRFAQWVSEGGFVIAVEPEEANFRQLSRTVEREGIASVIRLFRGVAAERAGTLRLAVNPAHPGDHKIAPEGIEVAAFTIDELAQDQRAGQVCLIKIDVQGAEERVLRGAHDIVQRDRPAIFVELDDDALRSMGSSLARVLAWLFERDYVALKPATGQRTQLLSGDEIGKLCSARKYIDLLFVHTSRIEGSTS